LRCRKEKQEECSLRCSPVKKKKKKKASCAVALHRSGAKKKVEGWLR
jgi:hypothetical protein